MKKIDFLFIYELENRELENILLVGSELEKRGYTVDYVKFYYDDPIQLRKKYFNNVKVVLTQSLYDTNVLFNLVYYIFGPVKKVVNLQWEQVGTVESEADPAHYLFPKGIAKEAVHICWGKTPRDNLLRAGVKSNKAIITGPVQMDFLRKGFNKYYKGKIDIFDEFKLDNNKKTILFVSSFSYVNLNPKAIAELSSKVGEEEVNKFMEISVNSQATFLNWIERFLKENQDVNFIYRPHPSERKSTKLQSIKNMFHNFYIIEKYSVKQWMLVADKIFTWYSTSIAEAYFSNRECMIVRPIKIPNNMEVTIMCDTNKIEDYTSFGNCINNNNNNINSFNKGLIEDYYDVDTDIPSYIRLSNLLESVLEKDEYNFIWDSNLISSFKKRLIKQKMKDLVFEIYHKVLKKGDLQYIENSKNIKIKIDLVKQKIGDIIGQEGG